MIPVFLERLFHTDHNARPLTYQVCRPSSSRLNTSAKPGDWRQASIGSTLRSSTKQGLRVNHLVSGRSYGRCTSNSFEISVESYSVPSSISLNRRKTAAKLCRGRT